MFSELRNTQQTTEVNTMKEISRTSTCVSFEGNGKLANMVADNSFHRYYKVIVKDENDNIKVLATRCTEDKAVRIIKEFLA